MLFKRIQFIVLLHTISHQQRTAMLLDPGRPRTQARTAICAVELLLQGQHMTDVTYTHKPKAYEECGTMKITYLESTFPCSVCPRPAQARPKVDTAAFNTQFCTVVNKDTQKKGAPIYQPQQAGTLPQAAQKHQCIKMKGSLESLLYPSVKA